MQSSGGVKLVLKPGQDDKAVGFFSKDKPVFITCKDLVYTKGNKKFLFKEDVRIWQDKTSSSPRSSRSWSSRRRSSAGAG